MPKKGITTSNWICRAKEVHGNKYDYSKVEYTKAKNKVSIICPKHGDFLQASYRHLQGHGCRKCGKKYNYTTPEWISKAKEIHGDKYDYSKVEYTNALNKVIIICPEHGEFLQASYSHLDGHNCAKCVLKYNYTTLEWISKAKEIHGDKYDYSKVDYINNKHKIIIICPQHGEFLQKPNCHLNGNNCIKCVENYKPTTPEWISKAKEIHGNKYDYSKVDYISNKYKIIIICKKHGQFNQIPAGHLSGQGCPVCNESSGEKMIYNILTKYYINFETQKKFKDCKNIRPLPFDFYLPDYHALIEYDGIQHFKIIEFFGEKSFIDTQCNDKIKNEYCLKKLIPLLRINYTDKNPEKIISDWLDLN